MNRRQKNKKFFDYAFSLGKDRKGLFLAEEVVKMIIALIALGLLAYLLFSLYGLNKTSNDLEFAEESLEHLIKELKAERGNIEIYNPEGWWITEDRSFGEGSLCICKKLGKCGEAGACLQNPNRFSIAGDIKIENPPIVLEVNYGSRLISKR